MGNIVLLDDLTINKIAAGEVIERPANVVKELVENSSDAGATNIIIEIKKGGKSYIKITDNGSGITPDDMIISMERHATSKIRYVEDLEKIYTMGFRGEALASIASISRLTIISKTTEMNTALQLISEGGEIIEHSETAANNGTISVELFIKFIKAISGLLNTVANNTSPIGQIYDVLSNNLGKNNSSSG